MKNGSAFGRVVTERPQSRLLPRNYAACRGRRGATSSTTHDAAGSRNLGTRSRRAIRASRLSPTVSGTLAAAFEVIRSTKPKYILLAHFDMCGFLIDSGQTFNPLTTLRS